MDVPSLIQALNNKHNETFLDLNNIKIENEKNNALKKIKLEHSVFIQMNKSLKNYRYIDELHDLKYGSYVRWILLNTGQESKLTRGGIVCDIQVDNKVRIICKNKYNNIFSFYMSDCVVFQKLSKQEQVLLSALNYLNN